MPHHRNGPKTPEGIEHKAKQWEFRRTLGELKGFGCAGVLVSPFVPEARKAELRALLAAIEPEVRAAYREYQLTYGSAHPVTAPQLPKESA